MDQADSHQGSTPVLQQGNNQGTSFIDFSGMDWATDVQSADFDHSLIAAGSTEFQYPVQNFHGLLPQYREGSEHVSGAVAGSSAFTSSAILDNAHQSIPARSHSVQYPSSQQTPAALIDLQYVPAQSHTFDNQQSLADFDHCLQSNVFSVANNAFSPAQPQAECLGTSSHIFDDQQFLATLDDQLQSNVFSVAQLPDYLNHNQQSLASLDDQLQNRAILPASHIFDDLQSKSILPASYMFDDQQSLATLNDQLQSRTILPAQPQSDYLRSNILQSQSNPEHVLNEQPSSIVIPLTPASAEYHNTDTALVIQDLGKLNRRQNPCIGCRLQKKKCNKNASDTNDPRCVRCAKKHFPLQMCIPLQILKPSKNVKNFKVFEKWLNETYEMQFTLVVSSDPSPERTAELKHYPDGPFLLVDCCEFRPTEHYQTRALLNPKMDISTYVRDCTRYAIYEVCKRKDFVSPFFKIACSYSNEPVIRRCFEMYTALRLMLKGCQFSGTRKERTGIEDDYLDMTRVEDRNSAWFGDIPVPRMVANQVNHRLELRMAELDSEIMEEVVDILETGERHMWLIGILASFLVLNIRELDAGRNIFWRRYRDSLGFWIHPLKPQTLIEEATASCSALLTTFHHTIGKTPLGMDWDNQKSRDMVNNDPKFVDAEKFIDSMKTLQTCVSALDGKIGRKACDVYEDGNPTSVDFTASSLLFANMTEGCEVKGLY